jgi:MFS family permease
VDEQTPQPTTHLTPDPAAQPQHLDHEKGQSPEPEAGKSWRRLFALDFTPLRDSREFRLLYLGQSITFFGSMMTFVALPWQVFQLTKSTFVVGMLGVVEFVAVLFMGFVGGAVADYFDRRLMVRLTEAALAIGSTVLIINALLPQPKVWLLFACASLFAALIALQRPSLEALIPRIVNAEQMPAVAALQAFRGSIAMIGGPALGGLLVVTFGPALAFSVDLFTFIVSLIALTLMQAVPPPPDADRPGIKSIIEGLRYARSRQELLGTYLVDMNAMFFGIPMALFPAIAESLRRSFSGFTLCGTCGRRIGNVTDVRLDQASQPPRPRSWNSCRVLGSGDHRFWFRRAIMACAFVPGHCRRVRHDQWGFPHGHLEPNDSRSPARTTCGN